MTIIGEMYQAQGTQNTFCRSNRPIAVSECYSTSCPANSPIEGKNDLQFYSYNGVSFGLMGPEVRHPPPRFMCEEP
jgi:hypothetical protein